jgi:hypothetical protein
VSVARVLLPTLLLVSVTGCGPEERRACTPPPAEWGKPHDFSGLLPPVFRVSVDQTGQVYWDGSKITPMLLSQRLSTVRAARPPQPIVFLETEMGAPCDRVDSIRAEMNRILRCTERRGICSEGIMTVWEHTPPPRGSPPS